MKVLFTTNLPSPYRVEFFNELGKLCDLTVAYERRSASDRNAKWVSAEKRTYKEIFLNGKSIGVENSFCPSVLKLLKKGRFDCIVVGVYSTYTSMLAITYMKLKRIPFIISSDGGMIKGEKGFKYKLKKFLIGSACAWLSTGNSTSKYLEYYGADINAKTKINNLIIEKPLSSEEKLYYRNKLGMKEQKIILSIGQFIHRKGYDILMNACKDLDKNYGIYIVGGTPTEEYLQLQKDLDLTNVYFVDFMSKTELADYYKAADLFVLPTREDIWGLVVNEAMSYGLPVITTDNCVAGLELVDDKNGRVIKTESVKALKDAILAELENSDNLYQKGINSIRKIETYTIEEMAQTHMRIFEDIKKNSI